MKNKMKIWIDIDNAPHVNFMEPIIKELNRRKINYIVTARDYAQTIPLLKSRNFNFAKVGNDFGGNRIICTLKRAILLYRLLKWEKIDVGLSHGSRSMAIAGSMLGLKNNIITIDYEFVEHRIFNLFATKILMPNFFKNIKLNKIGYSLKKLEFYPGYKEEIYLNNYFPDNKFLDNNNLPKDKIIITARPPAEKSHYYKEKINYLFWKIVDYISKYPDVFILLIPRYPEQVSSLFQKIAKYNNIKVLWKVVNGLDLLYYSDLFIGAGGTMNREAALLRTPSYSLFYKEGEIDKSLKEKGLLKFIHSEEDIEYIKIKKKTKNNTYNFNKLSIFFVNYLLKND